MTTKTRITPEDIDAAIASTHYFTAADGVLCADGRYTMDGDVLSDHDRAALKLLTFCVLVLKNGFTVTGESACVDPANFDEAKGREVALQKAKDKMWPLLGYALKERLTA